MWKPTAVAKFITNREIFGFILIVLFNMILVFPKGKLERLIFEEDSNITLSNMYLESLVKVNPDPSLKLLIAERYIKIGEEKKAIRHLDDLEKSNDPDILGKAKFLRYSILKQKFFSKNVSLEEKEYLRHQMKAILEESYKSMIDVKELEREYKEALSMEFQDLAYKISIKILRIKPKDIHWLKESYKLAIMLKDYENAIRFLQKLVILDKENSFNYNKEIVNVYKARKDFYGLSNYLEYLYKTDSANKYYWAKELLNLYSYQKQYGKAISLLEQLYETDTKNKDLWLKQLTDLYLYQKQYEKALNIYLAQLNMKKNALKRREYFKKAVEIALWSKNFELAKNIIFKHYKEFLNDIEMMKFVLKSSLATGDPKFAYKIALDIKQRVI
ncbi:tetratricopeptide repeat protein [Sulfurihydrogenibium sp.]|jgi:tetratricopeptide (TPR) repeat protein|uniref:tetratricopeptide repeat protein n=1 Tax=Sulfurihydrogenibium sp. TaxID=2053621 RepID=UPI00262388A3|nr:tetratricopeptide repeat protein [Sulfurihydrogenibium sp.]